MAVRLIESITNDLDWVSIRPLGVTRIALLLVRSMNLFNTAISHIVVESINFRHHMSLLCLHLGCLCLTTTLSLLPIEIRIIQLFYHLVRLRIKLCRVETFMHASWVSW